MSIAFCLSGVVVTAHLYQLCLEALARSQSLVILENTTSLPSTSLDALDWQPIAWGEGRAPFPLCVCLIASYTLLVSTWNDHSFFSSDLCSPKAPPKLPSPPGWLPWVALLSLLFSSFQIAVVGIMQIFIHEAPSTHWMCSSYSRI